MACQMRFMTETMLATLALTLSGCAEMQLRQAQTQARTTHTTALQECRAQFPYKIGGMTARAQCFGQADYALADAFPRETDLLHLIADTRSDLAEKVDRGQIGLSDAKLQLDRVVIQVRQESANRQAADQEARSEQAQQWLALSQAMTPPRPVTTNCIHTGYMTNCTTQ